MSKLKKQIIELYNYDVAGGAHTFDPIVNYAGDDISIQFITSGFDAADATLTVEGSNTGQHFDTITDSGGNDAVITLPTGTFQQQVSILTFSGTTGTIDVTCEGVTKTLTIATTLSQAVADFVTANAAAYLAVDIVITAQTNKLTFTGNTGFNQSFLQPTVASASDDLTAVYSLITSYAEPETSCTLNINEIVTNYLRFVYAPGSVTTGTIKTVMIKYS